jgi:hypothetical protein
LPERVIDLAEVLEVEKKDGQPLLSSLGTRESEVEALAEVSAAEAP